MNLLFSPAAPETDSLSATGADIRAGIRNQPTMNRQEAVYESLARHPAVPHEEG